MKRLAVVEGYLLGKILRLLRKSGYLGELNGSAHARWQKTIEVFNEQGESTQLKLFPSDLEVADDIHVARVLVKKVRVERTRKFGDCYLGLELWKRLQLDDFFADLLSRPIPMARLSLLRR